MRSLASRMSRSKSPWFRVLALWLILGKRSQRTRRTLQKAGMRKKENLLLRMIQRKRRRVQNNRSPLKIHRPVILVRKIRKTRQIRMKKIVKISKVILQMLQPKSRKKLQKRLQIKIKKKRRRQQTIRQKKKHPNPMSLRKTIPHPQRTQSNRIKIPRTIRQNPTLLQIIKEIIIKQVENQPKKTMARPTHQQPKTRTNQQQRLPMKTRIHLLRQQHLQQTPTKTIKINRPKTQRLRPTLIPRQTTHPKTMKWLTI